MSLHHWVYLACLSVALTAMALCVAIPSLRQTLNHWDREHPWRIGAFFGTPLGVLDGLSEGPIEGLVIAAIWFFGWGWLRRRMRGARSW